MCCQRIGRGFKSHRARSGTISGNARPCQQLARCCFHVGDCGAARPDCSGAAAPLYLPQAARQALARRGEARQTWQIKI